MEADREATRSKLTLKNCQSTIKNSLDMLREGDTGRKSRHAMKSREQLLLQRLANGFVQSNKKKKKGTELNKVVFRFNKSGSASQDWLHIFHRYQ